MLKKIVLDLETQKSFEEVGGRGKNHLLKISVCGIYDYSTNQYTIYEESELPRLASVLQTADQIIGNKKKNFEQMLNLKLNWKTIKSEYWEDIDLKVLPKNAYLKYLKHETENVLMEIHF